MLPGRVADCSVSDIELVAAHAPMVNLPGHHIACDSGVAKWALVGLPLVLDATIFDSKLLATVLPVIYAARPDTATNDLIAKRTCVLECIDVALLEASAGLAWLRRRAAICCRRCSCTTCLEWTRMVGACLAFSWLRRVGSCLLATRCVRPRDCHSPRRSGSDLLATLCVLRRECRYLLSDCIYDFLLPLLLDAVPEAEQAFVRRQYGDISGCQQ